MTITFRSPSCNGSTILPENLISFFLWLSENHASPRAASILTLISEHDRESDEAEKSNIRRTIAELLESAPVLAPRI